MGIYARHPRRWLAQLSADIFVLAWSVAWWLVSRAVRRAVLVVAAPARETAGTAGRISSQLRDASEQAGRVPGIGSQLRQPLDAAASSFSEVVNAANHQVTSIERLAGVVGWLVFLIPVALIVTLWLPRRLGYYLRARAAQRYVDSSADLDLFALRAMTSQPMHVLAKISDDPAGAWRNGDATVISKLAEVELRRSGLHMPTPGPRPGTVREGAGK